MVAVPAWVMLARVRVPAENPEDSRDPPEAIEEVPPDAPKAVVPVEVWLNETFPLNIVLPLRAIDRPLVEVKLLKVTFA